MQHLLVTLAGLVEAQAGLNIPLRGDLEVGLETLPVLGVEVLQKGHTPLAACACAEALADE